MRLSVRKLAYLTPGVHPGVGAARADEGDGLPRQPRHRRFHHPLDGGRVRLALPAVVAGAVVFQEEADVAGHAEV